MLQWASREMVGTYSKPEVSRLPGRVPVVLPTTACSILVKPATVIGKRGAGADTRQGPPPGLVVGTQPGAGILDAKPQETPRRPGQIRSKVPSRSTSHLVSAAIDLLRCPPEAQIANGIEGTTRRNITLHKLWLALSHPAEAEAHRRLQLHPLE